MKKYLQTVVLFFALANALFAQTLINEFDAGPSSEEAGRFDDFLINLQNTPARKGLVVINTNGQRLGNVLGQIKGMKHHASLRVAGPTDITFLISNADGKENFHRQFWLIPEGKEVPDVEQFVLKRKHLKQRFYYAGQCTFCDPDSPYMSIDQVDLNFFSELLKKNKKIKGQIVIDRRDLRYAVGVRKRLIDDYGVNISSVDIRFSKISPGFARFFLKPSK